MKQICDFSVLKCLSFLKRTVPNATHIVLRTVLVCALVLTIPLSSPRIAHAADYGLSNVKLESLKVYIVRTSGGLYEEKRLYDYDSATNTFTKYPLSPPLQSTETLYFDVKWQNSNNISFQSGDKIVLPLMRLVDVNIPMSVALGDLELMGDIVAQAQFQVIDNLFCLVITFNDKVVSKNVQGGYAGGYATITATSSSAGLIFDYTGAFNSWPLDFPVTPPPVTPPGRTDPGTGVTGVWRPWFPKRPYDIDELRKYISSTPDTGGVAGDASHRYESIPAYDSANPAKKYPSFQWAAPFFSERKTYENFDGLVSVNDYIFEDTLSANQRFSNFSAADSFDRYGALYPADPLAPQADFFYIEIPILDYGMDYGLAGYNLTWGNVNDHGQMSGVLQGQHFSTVYIPQSALEQKVTRAEVIATAQSYALIDNPDGSQTLIVNVGKLGDYLSLDMLVYGQGAAGVSVDKHFDIIDKYLTDALEQQRQNLQGQQILEASILKFIAATDADLLAYAPGTQKGNLFRNDTRCFASPAAYDTAYYAAIVAWNNYKTIATTKFLDMDFDYEGLPDNEKLHSLWFDAIRSYGQFADLFNFYWKMQNVDFSPADSGGPNDQKYTAAKRTWWLMVSLDEYILLGGYRTVRDDTAIRRDTLIKTVLYYYPELNEALRLSLDPGGDASDWDNPEKILYQLFGNNWDGDAATQAAYLSRYTELKNRLTAGTLYDADTLEHFRTHSLVLHYRTIMVNASDPFLSNKIKVVGSATEDYQISFDVKYRFYAGIYGTTKTTAGGAAFLKADSDFNSGVPGWSNLANWDDFLRPPGLSETSYKIYTSQSNAINDISPLGFTLGDEDTYTLGGSAVTLVTGDTGRFFVTGLTVGAKYWIREVAPPNGYQAYSTPMEFSVTAAGNAPNYFVQFDDPLGTLALEKLVVGTGADLSREFEFAVTFSGAEPDELSAISCSDPAWINGGTGTVKLSHGQTAYFDNLPIGVEYEITEIAPGADYHSDHPGNTVTGTVANHIVVEVVFTNTYDPLLTGKLTVGKNFNSGGINGATFRITDILGHPVLTDAYGNNLPLVEPDGTFVLYDGEDVTFEDLIPGLYTITEIGMAIYATTYTIDDGAGTFYGSGQVAYVGVSANSEYEVVFTNEVITAELHLQKVVTGSTDPNREFEFLVVFTYDDDPAHPLLADIELTINDVPQPGYTNGVSIFLKNGDVAHFVNIPIHSDCEVLIDELSDLTGYTIDGATLNGDDEPLEDDHTLFTTLDDDDDYIVIFYNHYNPPRGDLTVTKTVDPISDNRLFNFTLVDSNGHPVNLDMYTLAGNYQLINNGYNGRFVLGEGGSLTVTGLLAGETYTVTEDEATGAQGKKYTTTYTIDGTTVSGRIAELTVLDSALPGAPAQVTFTNKAPIATGAINLKKLVPHGDDTEFTFAVSFSGAEGIDEITCEGSLFGASGTVKLKGGDSILFENIPLHARYTIVEEAVSWYETNGQREGMLDVIRKEITFTNEYVHRSYTLTGNKTVVGDDVPSQSFAFTLTQLNSLDPDDVMLDYDGNPLHSSTTTRTGAGAFSFLLEDLEPGATYYFRVSETGGGGSGWLNDTKDRVVIVTVHPIIDVIHEVVDEPIFIFWEVGLPDFVNQYVARSVDDPNDPGGGIPASGDSGTLPLVGALLLAALGAGALIIQRRRQSKAW